MPNLVAGRLSDLTSTRRNRRNTVPSPAASGRADVLRGLIFPESAKVQVRGMASARERRQVLEILVCAAWPAFRVLRADQAVRPTAAIGRLVEVGLGPPNAVLGLAAVGFCGLQYPGLPLGVSKEASQFGAVPAAAGECGCPAPINRWRQGLGDAEAQVRGARYPQPLD